ncbi:MAG: CaiB/BaiF CoA-transferase family protein, partial [bacterium]|nr:CaiB/BaiF CoA-transferase family protein [bacterium]
VILRITAFGQEGPYAQRPGFATLAEALSGYAAISGEADGPPLLPPVAITDELTGTLGAFGALAALWEARRSGKGQVVDLSLVESVMHIIGPLPSAFAHLGYEQPRLGAGIPYSVPRGTYRCSDGEWVALSASTDTVANRVLGLIGTGGDERFGTFAARFENRDALEALMAGWIAARPSGEVIRRFEEVDAAIAPVYTMADLFADEHFRRRGLFTTVDGVVMQAVSPRLSRTPGRVNFAGRPLGADTEEVLAELRGGDTTATERRDNDE